MIRTACLLIVAASVVTANGQVSSEQCIDYHPECPECENANSKPTLLPYYQDCHKFYKCDNGRACVFSCPIYDACNGQSVFNPELQICDCSRNVPGLPNCPDLPPITLPPTNLPPTNPPPTNPSPTNPPPTNPPPTSLPSTSLPPTSPPATNAPPTNPPAVSTTPGKNVPAACLKECPANGPARVRHATECNSYYDCIRGKPVLRRCVQNLYFNCYVQACDRAKNLPSDYPCSDLDLQI